MSPVDTCNTLQLQLGLIINIFCSFGSWNNILQLCGQVSFVIIIRNLAECFKMILRHCALLSKKTVQLKMKLKDVVCPMMIINQELFNLLTAWHLTSDRTRSGKMYHLLTKLLMKMLTKSMLSIYLWWGLIIRGLARPSQWQFSPAQMISLIISHGRWADACKQASSPLVQPSRRCNWW